MHRNNSDVKIHIQRLVLEGIDVPHRHRPDLQAAVEAELTHLLVADGLAPELLAGGAMPSVPAGAIQLTGEGEPSHLGQQIAQAVHGGIGK